MSECSKSAQKEYKTTHDWVGKVIHWEMCKKFRFDKQIVYAQPSSCPGEWDALTNGSLNLSQKTKPYSNPQKKRTCKIVDFAVLAGHRIKLKESEKKDKYLDLARELKKKLWNMKVTIIPIVVGAFGTVIKGTGGLGSWRKKGDHNGQKTEKSPGDVRKLAVTQTPVKDHQLKLIWKTLKE